MDKRNNLVASSDCKCKLCTGEYAIVERREIVLARVLFGMLVLGIFGITMIVAFGGKC